MYSITSAGATSVFTASGLAGATLSISGTGAENIDDGRCGCHVCGYCDWRGGRGVGRSVAEGHGLACGVNETRGVGLAPSAMRTVISSWRKKHRKRLSRLRRADPTSTLARSPLDMATAKVLRTQTPQKGHNLASAGPRCRSSNLSHSPLRCGARNLCQRLDHQIRIQTSSATLSLADTKSSDLKITIIPLMHIFDTSTCSSIASSGSPPSSVPRFLDGGTTSDRLLISVDSSGPRTGVLPSFIRLIASVESSRSISIWGLTF